MVKNTRQTQFTLLNSAAQANHLAHGGVSVISRSPLPWVGALLGDWPGLVERKDILWQKLVNYITELFNL